MSVLTRDGLRGGAIVWATIGFGIGLMEIGSINADARLLFDAAWVGGPLAAVLASIALANRHDRAAGGLLLVSVVTPTFFAWPLTIPALVTGLALTITPLATVDERRVRPN
jgi:hypothetical protein